MRGIHAAGDAWKARSGTRFTVVWLVFTVACTPAWSGIVCRTDHDCPTVTPSCGCDGICALAGEVSPNDAGVDGGVPTVLTVVIARWRTTASEEWQAFGLDLDDMNGGPTDSCAGFADFVSPITNDHGIDNQLSLLEPSIDTLVGGDGWDGALATSVLDGSAAIVLEVTARDGGGCARRVHAWTATADDISLDPACSRSADETACEASATCVWSPAHRDCRGVSAAQTWRATADLGEVDARVVRGRLLTSPFAHLPLLPTIAPMNQAPVLAPIPMHDVSIEADVDATTVTRGELGGVIEVTDAVAWTNTHLLQQPLDETTLEQLLEPDLEPNGNGSVCAALSAGLGFETQSAILVH